MSTHQVETRRVEPVKSLDVVVDTWKTTKGSRRDIQISWVCPPIYSLLNRAMSMSYRSTLFVSNLPYTATSTDLKTLFSDIAPVRSAFVVLEHETGVSKGVGYVSFAIPEDAKPALDTISTDGLTLDGRKLRVELAENKVFLRALPLRESLSNIDSSQVGQKEGTEPPLLPHPKMRKRLPHDLSATYLLLHETPLQFVQWSYLAFLLWTRKACGRKYASTRVLRRCSGPSSVTMVLRTCRRVRLSVFAPSVCAHHRFSGRFIFLSCHSARCSQQTARPCL